MGESDETTNLLRRTALLISIYFPPEPGGASSAAWNRAVILQKIGYTVFVLCGFPAFPDGRIIEPKYKGKYFYVEKKDNFTLIRLRLLPLKSKGYLRRFILFINFILLSLMWTQKILRISANPELVYAITPTLFGSLIGKAYSKVTKSFFIYESTDLWPEQLVAFRSKFSFIINHLGKFLAKISYNLPDLIIVTSNRSAQYVTSNYKPKVLVYTLPVGVDPSKYRVISKKNSRSELIENKIIPPDLDSKFIVLYAGTINKVTNVDNLLHAADKLKDIQNDIVFLVIGEGDEKEKLAEIRLNNEINNFILLPFPYSRAHIPKIISSADVCVVSLSSEPIYEATIPTKFFDYLACHKPQIGICSGELASMINDNNVGITVLDGQIDKLVDTILSLKNSSTLIQSFESNSQVALQEYSLDTLASKFNIFLNKLRTTHEKSPGV